jgi:hypothetical protein
MESVRCLLSVVRRFSILKHAHKSIKMKSHLNKSRHSDGFPLLQRGIEGDFSSAARTYLEVTLIGFLIYYNKQQTTNNKHVIEF